MGEGTEGCSRQLEERNLQQLKNILELEQCRHPWTHVSIPLCFLIQCLSIFLFIELQLTGVWAWRLGPGVGVRLQGHPLLQVGFTDHLTGLRLI